MMLIRTRLLPSLLLLLVAGSANAQEDRTSREQQSEQEALEQEFERNLSGATLVGAFTLNGAPEDAPLNREKYTIHKVKKLQGDVWLFNARIEYGGKDVTVPIPLTVKWAGDTPVITLTDLAIPGMGSFTARVLFYRNEYAGTWDAGDHGGQMFGKIVPAAAGSAGEGDSGDEDSGEEDSGEEDGGDAADDQDRDRTTVHWPSFRGTNANGIADGHPLPVSWNLESGRNVLWKTPIPGLSHSSPVIWGDRMFVLTAERLESDDAELTVGLYGSIAPVADEGEHGFYVYCLDKNTGEVLWDALAYEGVPEIKRHPKGSHAASSPVTDGEHVVALFASEGLYCYSVDGEKLWSKDLGTLDSGFYMVKDAQWGHSSSPILYKDLLILQVDCQDESYLMTLDVHTGEEIWRTERGDMPTWSTPTVHVDGDRAQVVCNGWKEIGGYNLMTGQKLWTLEGGGDIPVPTPVIANDLIFITNAHGRMAPIFAIRTDASGELSMKPEECADMAWSQTRYGNYMQTPLVYDDLLYMCNDAGVLKVYDSGSGEQHYKVRVGEGQNGYTASMVAGDGKLYITSEEGRIHVLNSGTEYEPLATSEMGETCMATPAISAGVIYFRTRGHLVAISGDEPAPPEEHAEEIQDSR